MRTRIAIGLLIAPLHAMAHPGNGIVALSENAVFTGDAVHSCLWKFESSKSPEKLTGSTRFHCHWVTKGLDGNLYSETLANRNGRWMDTVYKMDTQGRNPVEIASGGEGAFGIFAIGRSGEIVHKQGDAIVSWSNGKNAPFRKGGKVASGQPTLGDVAAFAWGPNDTLYLADGPRIRKIGSDGVVRTVATITGTVIDKLYAGRNDSSRIWGLTVDASGRTFVAVPSNGQVIRIDKDGSQHVIARNSDGWAATGVAVFGSTVFLYECKTQGNSNFGPRVRAIRANGAIETLGTAS